VVSGGDDKRAAAPASAEHASTIQSPTPSPVEPTELGHASTVGSGDPPGPVAPIAAGTRVGPYELATLLGAGGMGVVYRARDTRLGRDVAIKLVRPGDGDVAAARARLEREAQAMARLSDPNVVVVYDIGAYGDQLYVAMELLAGGPLGAWLASAPPWREILARFAAAGRGLAAAHGAGLVHRDFKPDNVLLGARGEVKVTDFGLVRDVGDAVAIAPDDRDARLRTTGFAGTPLYMAPEQLRCEHVDARADQFSFCVALWQALTGERPFAIPDGAGRPIEQILGAIDEHRLQRGERAVPGHVLAIVERGLAADPAARWPSMAVLLGELERASRRRRRQLAIAAVVVGLAAVAVVVGLALRPVPDTPRAVAPATTPGAAPATVVDAAPAGVPAQLTMSVPADLVGEARKHYDLAIAAYRKGYNDQAAEEFQRAYNIYPVPEFLFNLAVVHERMGKCDEAKRDYDLYLARSSEVTDGDRRTASTVEKRCRPAATRER
jgi:hypothetical protein